nr:hypothetical protein [Tanacetum cinerariifolium]
MSNPHQELSSPEANGFCKELASPKQTTLGKNISNPFMAGSFPKTLCCKTTFIHGICINMDLFEFLLVYLVVTSVLVMNRVLIEAQQHISNESPLLGVNTPRCDEDSIELMELMVFLATATIKRVNDVVQFHALIDRKKVVVIEDVIKSDLCLDDVDGVECLPNEEIFAELARMGYEKHPLKLTFYKAFFSTQWKFLIHIRVQCISAKRTVWNEFSCSMASVVICLATSRKFNFSKHIFDSMNKTSILKFGDSKAKEKGKDVREEEVKVFRGKIEAIDADEDINLVDVETQVDMDVKLHWRIDQDVSAATKDVSAVEPTVFDDEEVTMNMAQTLIKMKEKKAKLLDEQIAQILHDEEIEKAAAREKQEKDDLERAKVLQMQYEDKKKNIDWNTVAEKYKKSILTISGSTKVLRRNQFT